MGKQDNSIDNCRLMPATDSSIRIEAMTLAAR